MNIATANQAFIGVATKPVLDFLEDLEKLEIITPDQAQAARRNLAKDTVGTEDNDALTDTIGNWMAQLTEYSRLNSYNHS